MIKPHTDECGRTNGIVPRSDRAASFTRLLGSTHKETPSEAHGIWRREGSAYATLESNRRASVVRRVDVQFKTRSVEPLPSASQDIPSRDLNSGCHNNDLTVRPTHDSSACTVAVKP